MSFGLHLALFMYKHEYEFTMTSKILIIDDDQLSLESLHQALDSQGFSCKSFLNPEKAMQYLTSNPDFDVVLTDLKMTPINGIEVMKQVKKIEPKLPVILISGHVTKPPTEMEFFFSKPIDIRNLISTLNIIINK